MPELISGSAVAPARIVAPKIAPLIPARLASSLPLTSSATPIASVTTQPIPKMPATCAVERFANGCASTECGSRRFCRPRCEPVHRHLPARRLPHLVDHVEPERPDDDDPERRRAEAVEDLRRRLQQRAHQHARDDERDEQPLEHRAERTDEERQRPLAADDDVADDQHHRLDGDPADQVAGREAEVAARRGRHRDRELGQAPGDREEQQSAELLAQIEARVEGVGRFRERCACHPRCNGPGQRRPGRGARMTQPRLWRGRRLAQR